MSSNRSDLILLGGILAIIIFAIVITAVVQTEIIKSDIISQPESSLLQIKTFGPVWNSDSWSCSSDKDFLVHGVLRGIGQDPQIDIQVVTSGTQSLLSLEPTKMQTFSIGAAADDTIIITRNGTVTGFLTLETSPNAVAFCTRLQQPIFP